MVIPKSLVESLKTVAAELYRGGHLLTQRALAEFIQEGHYAAHIRRMRILYGKRRAFLIELIERYLGTEFIHEFSHAAGLHRSSSCQSIVMTLQLPEWPFRVVSK